MSSKRQQQEEAGRWLRRAREQRGLHTAGALARLMGVSDSLVSRIETGNTAVTNERAEQIAEALGMDIITVRRNLHLWVPDSGGAMDQVEEGLDENERLIADILALPPRDQKAAKAAVKAVIAALKEDAETTDADNGNRH